ncbi:unnamed protein product [Acanthoscelides obtectus]|uniref:SAC3/GANP/THP3 conserved domain-containing protein n=1 Tax=Acanthoscelides obtectus TaxID=200917 RepID=A0A9P0M322_ACAOB|nr:unnamed protein product [Acanthoscelides obtectus]CAK1626406.1 Leukocyte receptor cluster member 8 [Acanthoscelides obtectus]
MAEGGTDVAEIPSPPGMTDHPPLPPEPPSPPPPAPPTQPPPPPSAPPTLPPIPNAAPWTQNQPPQLYYYNAAAPPSFMYPNYYYYYSQMYANPNNNEVSKAQPPLPPGPPLPPTPPHTPRIPLLNTPKQFGAIRFQLNGGKRLPNNMNILQTSQNSGAAKKKRKRNRNNQNAMKQNAFIMQNIGTPTPPLPPPEVKPAPPPETMPPLPPEEAKPPVQEPSALANTPHNGLTNATDDWPDSLKDYIHRCYAKCKTTVDKNQVEIILKGKITQAYQSGHLQKDWNNEPLPSIHSESTNKPTFTGQAKTVTGQLSQFQNGKKGLSPGLGARLGARAIGALQKASKGGGSARDRSRSPASSGTKRRSRSRSRSPKRYRSSSDSSRSSSDESSSKSKNSSRKSKGKLADRLGPSAKKFQAKSQKKRRSKEKKVVPFYSTFGQDVEENTEVLQQRAARFAGKSSNNSSANSTPSQTVCKRQYSEKFDESNGDFDWSGCHIVGTSQELEKSFLRLTKAPEACDVRPVEMLTKSLQNVKERWVQKQDYFYACDQLKSIRQDLTVQGIRNSFTIEVYETHARIALEKCDHEEFNQCQTQLKMLYNEIGGDNRNEFVGYRILYYIFTKNTLDIMTMMKSFTADEKTHPCIAFSLKVRSAWALGNFHKFFTLYREAPLMAGFLMDWFIDRERKAYLKCIIKRYVSDQRSRWDRMCDSVFGIIADLQCG